MKVPTVKSGEIIDKLSRLKTEMVYSCITGEHKAFKNAKKAYAEIAKDNFELSKQAKSPTVQNVPFFSKMGMRMLKIMLLEKFRIKTPAEKALKKLAKLDKAKQKINIYR